MSAQRDGSCTASRHGDENAYINHDCRCPAARAAHRAGRRRRYNRLHIYGPAHIDATGTARRLQALSAIGYALPDLAELLNSTTTHVSALRIRNRRSVHRLTAARVDAMYTRLSATPGPSTSARSQAERRGWQPPLAWDDTTIDDPQAKPWQWCQDLGTQAAHDPVDVIAGGPLNHEFTASTIDPVVVDRLIHGQQTPHTRAERRAAATYLLEHGHSCAAIADRLGVAERTIQRLRTRLGVGPREDAQHDTDHEQQEATA